MKLGIPTLDCAISHWNWSHGQLITILWVTSKESIMVTNPQTIQHQQHHSWVPLSVLWSILTNFNALFWNLQPARFWFSVKNLYCLLGFFHLHPFLWNFLSPFLWPWHRKKTFPFLQSSDRFKSGNLWWETDQRFQTTCMEPFKVFLNDKSQATSVGKIIIIKLQCCFAVQLQKLAFYLQEFSLGERIL